MAKVSYATQRKIKIIERQVGPDWKNTFDGARIDAIYNQITGDSRKNLFCKIRPTVKEHLDEMTVRYDIKMAELIERLIRDEYEKFIQRKQVYRSELANQFVGD